MDILQDCFSNGRKFRTLTIVDDFTRECPAIEVDTSIPGARVVRVMDRLAQTWGIPRTIISDNGGEIIGRAMDAWANRHGVKLHFIDPGKPTQNAYIESFNGKFRDECLDQNWFTDLADARGKIETWRVEYNTVRPHSSLAMLPLGSSQRGSRSKIRRPDSHSSWYKSGGQVSSDLRLVIIPSIVSHTSYWDAYVLCRH